MPFCKRTIVPKDVCKSRGAMFTDLVDVCGLTLCAVLRQLSDLSRQSVSILEELEGELASICYRSGALENKLISLQKHIAALATKPPAKSRNFSVLYTLFLTYTCVVDLFTHLANCQVHCLHSPNNIARILQLCKQNITRLPFLSCWAYFENNNVLLMLYILCSVFKCSCFFCRCKYIEMEGWWSCWKEATHVFLFKIWT